MIDYHAKQFDGGQTACDGRNCAAASDAMAIHAGTGGSVVLTSDDVRALSRVSCVPGENSPSGGLYISDVIRVANMFSVKLDYGQNPYTGYTRWPSSEAKYRLSADQGGIFLGDYDQVRSPYRAATAFLGDHSVWAHDYRTDQPPYMGTVATPTVCWHDPLRSTPIRVPLTVLLAYWQKDGSPVKGFAGFTPDKRIKHYRVHLRPLLRWWRYYRENGIWTRQQRYSPLGWEADCTAPQTVRNVMGKDRRMVRVTSGGYSVMETWLDLDSSGVTLKEV